MKNRERSSERSCYVWWWHDWGWTGSISTKEEGSLLRLNRNRKTFANVSTELFGRHQGKSAQTDWCKIWYQPLLCLPSVYLTLSDVASRENLGMRAKWGPNEEVLRCVGRNYADLTSMHVSTSPRIFAYSNTGGGEGLGMINIYTQVAVLGCYYPWVYFLPTWQYLHTMRSPRLSTPIHVFA